MIEDVNKNIEQDIEQEGGESASESAPVPRTQSPDGLPPPFLPEFKKFIEEIKLLRKAYNPKAKNNAAYEARRTAILYHHENTWDM